MRVWKGQRKSEGRRLFVDQTKSHSIHAAQQNWGRSNEKIISLWIWIMKYGTEYSGNKNCLPYNSFNTTNYKGFYTRKSHTELFLESCMYYVNTCTMYILVEGVASSRSWKYYTHKFTRRLLVVLSRSNGAERSEHQW